MCWATTCASITRHAGDASIAPSGRRAQSKTARAADEGLLAAAAPPWTQPQLLAPCVHRPSLFGALGAVLRGPGVEPLLAAGISLLFGTAPPARKTSAARACSKCLRSTALTAAGRVAGGSCEAASVRARGCRSRSTRRGLVGRHRDRHAPGRAHPNRRAVHGRERAAAVRGARWIRCMNGDAAADQAVAAIAKAVAAVTRIFLAEI